MKRVFLTGGSRGLGAACVRRFAREGWEVLFTYRRSEAEALALCKELPNTACLQMDLADPIAAYELACSLGRFDAVVNNGGESLMGLFQDADTETAQRFWNVDLLSPFHLLRALCPQMLREGKGAAVNVASMWGQCGASYEALYSAAKGALISLTKALAWELALSGIRVNCVSPGVIDTRMNSQLSPEEKRQLCSAIPLGRFARPEEIAAQVFFLCSDASSYLTGALLCPNGGQVIGS